tara:strand:+ start:55 stop:333 length:279 start_codon:yes stop_codon:yes gene_type:complete
MKNVIISTGSLNYQYVVLDCIFAFDHAELSAGIDPQFEGVKQKLKDLCMELGGDAVINTNFQYNSAHTDGLFGAKQIIEIFAYGTVILFSQG